MAKPLRIEYEGAVYHVISRGNAEEPVFRDKEDRGNILVAIKKGDRKKRKKKVQEAVERHGYSQKEVADYIGIHYSVISKLLKG